MNILQLLAAKINPSDIGVDDPVKNANSALTNGLNAVYTWAGIICVLVIVVAGYFYVTAAGNPSQIKRAREAIIGSSIGVIVILMAFTITQFVIGRF